MNQGQQVIHANVFLFSYEQSKRKGKIFRKALKSLKGMAFYKIPTRFFPKRYHFGIIFATGFYFLFLNAMHFVSTKLYRFVKIGTNNSKTVAFRNFSGGFPLKTGKTAHPGYSWLCWLFKRLSRDCWDDIEAPHTGQRHLCPLPSWAVATCWSILS